MSSNYFTCTLGEVVGKSLDLTDAQTTSDFIDYQAKLCPRDLAVGFPVPGNGYRDWSYETFTFEDLRNGSAAIAVEIKAIIPPGSKISGGGSVGLLCPSSVDFLFAWLGLMRAGYSVLLIAPQCRPAAIAHLCESCNVSILIYEQSFMDLAFGAVSESKTKLIALQLPWQAKKTPVTSIVKNSEWLGDFQQPGDRNALDPAFIFHTSGTSTGIPKPIVQSHCAAFGVLPALDGRHTATLTTTPLYHGGIADCFRAWTSRALIWLFPAANVPITAQNICLCSLVAGKAASEVSAAQIKYFSSVPYVLKMLSEDSSATSFLQDMDIVGVGGAALSPDVGNKLVGKGINLVSRFGSAECGFLLSSHRDYVQDRDWQHLRLSPENNSLAFEELDDGSGLFELIVKKGWPHMSKSNRSDGGFATSDLFEPHPLTNGAWKYQGRSDSQITLNTGKKFDPTTMEDALAATSPWIQEVLIFGSGRDKPGILVFPSEQGLRMESIDFEVKIWEMIQVINCKGQDHTRIQKDMLVIMSRSQRLPERSSKGSLLRGRAEKQFAEYINFAYTRMEVPVRRAIKSGDIKTIVRRTIADVLGEDKNLDDDADFYVHGIDSATCIQIRYLLQKNLVPEKDILPWNVVYDCGNVNELSQFIEDLQNGDSKCQNNEQTEMMELLKQFSKFENQKRIPHDREQQANKSPHVVILTGATGALGAQILDILRKSSMISQIVCLVRAVDHFEARSRVSASLVRRGKPSLSMPDPQVWCLPCKLNDHELGLPRMELLHIRQTATHIIHAAWTVNFSLPLKSFVPEHIVGIHNLLNLTFSCSNAVHFTFCSSTSSILGPDSPSVIEEKISSNPCEAGLIGYSRSKWVAEAICDVASKTLPGSVNILRLGQLTGDSENGVWNISEAWPLMLSTVDVLHCLPQLEVPLSWLPLNTAAAAVIEIALPAEENRRRPNVFHLVNNSAEPTWSDLLAWVREVHSKPFDTVSPAVWMDKLESFPKIHQAKNLLGLWRNAFGRDSTKDEFNKTHGKTEFSMEETQRKSVVMQNVRQVDEELVKKIWSWLNNEIRAA